MKLVTAVLARDEAAPDRYLARVLKCCLSFSDAVLVLDDRSVDKTPEIARSLGCVVRTRAPARDPAWGHETPARVELWKWGVGVGCELGASNAWLLICDADMVLHGDPRPLCLSWEARGWAWPLADLWDTENTYRTDGPWAVGANTPRPWLFKVSGLPEGWVPQWSGRGIHCFHAPVNFTDLGPIYMAPPEMFWLHYSYLRKEHRQDKFAAYQRVSTQLSEFERAHCATILD